MKILVEGYPYDRKDVECVLGESTRQLMEDKVEFEYVGYCFKPGLGDCLFFLPKVVLEEASGKVFGQCRPEDIINLDAKTCAIDDKGREFLHELSMWIYQALVVYRNRNSESEILCSRTLPRRGHSRKRRLGMLFDIMIALRDFAQENRDFFLFQVKNRHRGLNRVDWRRTVAKTQAAITDGTPAYLAPVNRKREIDFDEELLVIFYSILGYIRDKYGFKAPIEFGYERIPKARFEAYLKGYGRRRLLQIKYKYFSDRALMLWELCYAFFDHSEAHSLAGTKEEFLLAKDFNIVFEAIIDELLGDQDLPKAARELKEQRDGKIIDHLWLDRNLIQGHHDNVYYIGDSKYYKIGSGLGKESLHKQYTYARNIIQWNLGLFHGTEDEKKKKAEAGKYGEFSLRDDVTEGYNIVPNFFISANLDAENPARAVKEIKPLGEPEVSRQFENRLFDRDTLILSRYNVNFLFVLSLYARNNAAAKSQWREDVRKEFCNKVRHTLENLFEFYAIRPLPGTDPVRFLRENFQRVLGKVYSPWQSPDNAPDCYSLALGREEVFKEENTQLIELLNQEFEVVKCGLDENPASAFEKAEMTMSPRRKSGSSSHIDITEKVVIIEQHKSPYREAVERTNWCPVDSSLLRKPEHLEMIVFPHTGGANLYRVRKDVSPVGPEQWEQREELATFKTVSLPGKDHWFFSVEPVSSGRDTADESPMKTDSAE